MKTTWKADITEFIERSQLRQESATAQIEIRKEASEPSFEKKKANEQA